MGKWRGQGKSSNSILCWMPSRPSKLEPLFRQELSRHMECTGSKDLQPCTTGKTRQVRWGKGMKGREGFSLYHVSHEILAVFYFNFLNRNKNKKQLIINEIKSVANTFFGFSLLFCIPNSCLQQRIIFLSVLKTNVFTGYRPTIIPACLQHSRPLAKFALN